MCEKEKYCGNFLIPLYSFIDFLADRQSLFFESQSILMFFWRKQKLLAKNKILALFWPLMAHTGD